ncbi:MAG: hypothetical protein OXP68_06665 [Anaerolineaceae bacterium]|nr:hypothetical protein [Anaerolineaceae bacterium]MDE0328271.1 hypothetical protein [Anaerolineaceae bacterium]
MNMEKWAGALIVFPMLLLAIVAFLMGELLPGMFHGMLHALENAGGGPLTGTSYAAWQQMSQLATFLRIAALALVGGLVFCSILIWRQRFPVPLHKLH